MKNQKGFTLIELMIVIAIIGILASIAIPAYGNYVKKSKFADVIQQVAPIKLAIDICFQRENDAAACDTWPEIELVRADYERGYVATNGANLAVGPQILMIGNAEVDNARILYNGAPSASGRGITWTADVGGSTCVAANLCDL